MSTATVQPGFKTLLPAEVNQALTAWWLAILFALAALFAATPLFPAPLTENGSLSSLGWITLILVTAATLVVGSFICIGFTKGRPAALKQFKLAAIVGMLVGLVAAAGLVWLLLQDKNPLGPSPILAGALIGIVGLLPFGFGGLALSMTNSDGVIEFFQEPVISIPSEPEPVVEASLEDVVMEDMVAEAPIDQTAAVDVVVDQDAIEASLKEQAPKKDDSDDPIKLDDPEEGLK